MNQIRVIVIMSILGALFEIWYLNRKNTSLLNIKKLLPVLKI